MQATQRSLGQTLILTPLEARLDASLAQDFKGQLVALVEQGHRYLILDLEAVEYIDSSGLSAIIAAFKRLGDQGKLVICRANETVTTIFRLSRLNRIIPLVLNLGEALETLGLSPQGESGGAT